MRYPWLLNWRTLFLPSQPRVPAAAAAALPPWIGGWQGVIIIPRPFFIAYFVIACACLPAGQATSIHFAHLQTLPLPFLDPHHSPYDTAIRVLCRKPVPTLASSLYSLLAMYSSLTTFIHRSLLLFFTSNFSITCFSGYFMFHCKCLVYLNVRV